MPRARPPSIMPVPASPESTPGSFLQGLTDTSLYSIGAYFSDQHPELVDEVLAQSEEIEAHGLRRWAEQDGTQVEQAFQTLMTGLAIRYFRAVAGAVS